MIILTVTPCSADWEYDYSTVDSRGRKLQYHVHQERERWRIEYVDDKYGKIVDIFDGSSFYRWFTNYDVARCFPHLFFPPITSLPKNAEFVSKELFNGRPCEVM